MADGMADRKTNGMTDQKVGGGPPPRGDVAAAHERFDVQQCGLLSSRIVQLETELAELKGNLVHGSAYAGRLIAGLQAADGRLEETVGELTRMIDWCMDMED